MKRTFILIVILSGVAGLLFAQGISGSNQHRAYTLKELPSLALPEAYILAMNRVGPATNRFRCVKACCFDPVVSGPMSKGWTFWFSDTNGACASVDVFFNGDVGTDGENMEILK